MVPRPLKWRKGQERKVGVLRVKSSSLGIPCQCSVTDLQWIISNHPSGLQCLHLWSWHGAGKRMVGKFHKRNPKILLRQAEPLLYTRTAANIWILFKHTLTCWSKQSKQMACTLPMANLQFCRNRDVLDTNVTNSGFRCGSEASLMLLFQGLGQNLQ